MNRRRQCAQIIGCNAERQGFAARLQGHAGNRQLIGGNDLIGPARLTGRDQFIPIGENGHFGPTGHGECDMAHRGGQCHIGGRQHAALTDQGIACREIKPRFADVAQPVFVGCRDDLVIRSRDMFLQHDGIRPFGHGRAGKNADGLFGFEVACEGLTRDRFPDHLQRLAGVKILRAHGIAIHGRSVEGRLGAQGAERGGCHPPQSAHQINAFGRHGTRCSQNHRERFFDRQQRHQLIPLTKCQRLKEPERPPCFSCNTIAPISIDRSTAFTIS